MGLMLRAHTASSGSLKLQQKSTELQNSTSMLLPPRSMYMAIVQQYYNGIESWEDQ